jgi:hypothetical protein
MPLTPSLMNSNASSLRSSANCVLDAFLRKQQSTQVLRTTHIASTSHMKPNHLWSGTNRLAKTT